MAHLTPGEPAPWFTARSGSRPDFQFSGAAGRYVVLSFIGSAGQAAMADLVAALAGQRALFDNLFASLLVVSCDPEDERQGRLAESRGVHILWDSDHHVTGLYGLLGTGEAGEARMKPASFVLDPQLRILSVLPFRGAASHARDIVAALSALKADPLPVPPAPVLLVPRVFEPDFCRRLVALHQQGPGEPSGFMRTDPGSGKTVLMHDPALKRRRDWLIEDEAVKEQIQARMRRRLVPEIRKAFQFEATRIERYIVARYGAEDGGFFGAHRDNTTKGTAHRRFAVTLNLNAEAYEGGDLVFPEHGGTRWRAPTGGALVFSCSLLHEARPVTRGARYCFLPFLYDEAAARIREENRGFVELPKDGAP